MSCVYKYVYNRCVEKRLPKETEIEKGRAETENICKNITVCTTPNSTSHLGFHYMFLFPSGHTTWAPRF